MRTLGVLLVLACGCPKSSDSPVVPASLVGDARRALAERERRLTSFRLAVESTEGESHAHHEVSFRSPNKSRAHLTAPQELELAFDGTTLVRRSAGQKAFEVVSLELPPGDRAFFLASQFMPFVPEGYRVPLLPLSGVEAKKVPRPDATEAVELTVRPGEGVTVKYVLRMPSGDFLEKRTLAEGKERVLRMETEQCEEKLRLCVPTKLVEKLGEVTLGTTEVRSLELNVALPQDTFSPR